MSTNFENKQNLYLFPYISYTEESFLNLSNNYELKLNLNLIYSILFIFECLKSHISYLFSQLSCLTGMHVEGRKSFNYSVRYDLLSLSYNTRLSSTSFFSEWDEISSIAKVYKSSTWWERETAELFGFLFGFQIDNRRLLTDYGFEGFPMRKSFPSFGFFEIEYNCFDRRISYKAISLTQEIRTFWHEIPWK